MTTERDDDLEPDESEAALEVEVRTENLEAGAGLVTPKDHAGYVVWLGRRQGLLGTIRSQEGEITLQGDGEGGVLIGGAWDGPQGPFSVLAALQQLDDADVFDSDTAFRSGNWRSSDLATLIAPFIGNSEFEVDGEGWFSDGEWAYPESPRDAESIVLAEATWEFESSTSYSIGADSGAWVLTRIGPRYIVYSINGHEYDRENLDAPDDESAVARFRSMMTGD